MDLFIVYDDTIPMSHIEIKINKIRLILHNIAVSLAFVSRIC
jgi:hypothetical protein